MNIFGRVHAAMLAGLFVLMAALLPVSAANAQITGMSPTSGAQGTTVTVTGTGFTADFDPVTIRADFKLGGNVRATTQATVVNDTTIRFLVPAGLQVGTTYDVDIDDSANIPAAAGTFRLTATITLSPSAMSGLATPIISRSYSQVVSASGGTGPYSFAITSGALPSGLTLASNGTISGTVSNSLSPGSNANVTITATDANGATGSEAYSIFIGAPSAPSLTSTSVREGPVAGGTTVVLTGTDFLGATSVTFGGNAATSFTVNSNTQITATTPAGSGFGQVVVTTPWGSSEPSGQNRIFVYLGQPTVTSVTPATGPTAGGTSVVLRGDNLFGTNISVTVGGVSANSVVPGSGPTAGEIRITTPANVPGTANIVVTTPGGVTPTSAANEFAYVPPLPQINSFSVYSGPATGGTAVTITGRFLTGPTQVTFGGVAAASVTVVNDTTITATTPAGTAGQVDVVITTLGGSITQSGVFEYTAPPVITSISPNTGSLSGGTLVVINGSGLQNATSVTFGGVPAINFNVIGSRIEAYSPSGSAGTVDVVVTSAAGSSATSSATRFTYANPLPQIFLVSSNVGSTVGGNRVSINGQYLNGVTSVTFGGVPALYFTVSSPSFITAYVPAGSLGTVSVAVTSPIGTTTVPNAYTYVDTSAVTITGLTSFQGPLAGGNEVGISGTNFTGATSVTFGGTAATSFTVVNSTSIRAVVPAGSATGQVAVSVTAPGGTATRSGAYNYVTVASPPTISSVNPSNISVDGGAVTINGARLVAVSAVTFNGIPGTSISEQGDAMLSVIAPAGSTGPVDISVTTPAGTTTLTNAATYIADRLPVISSVSPASGSNTGGTAVTITGTNFSGATAVRFGSATGTSFSVVSPTQISVVTPAIAAVGTQIVTISSPAGSSIVNANSRFILTSPSIPAPTISAVSPNNGAIAGGASVTITGTNFSGTASVRFGTVAATSFVVDSTTQITAVAPAGSAGAVDVSVTALGGMVTSSGAFTYNAPQQVPASQSISFTSSAPNGAVVGGATYTPTATATSGLSVVFSVDASSSAICSIAGGVVSFTGAGTCRINANQAGNSSFTAAAQVQQSFSILAAAPTITSVTPNSGSTAGGTSVVITGTNLTGASAVLFGSTAATSVTVDSATQITAIAPAATAGAYDVAVTTAGGTASVAGAFTYIAPQQQQSAPTTANRSGVAVAFSTATAIDLTSVITGSATSIAVATTPAHGTTSVAGNIVTYTPTAGYYGADSFTFTATGPGGTSAPATVSLTVGTPAAPVVAARSGVAVAFNSSGVAVDLSGSVSGVATSIAVATAPARGTTRVAGNIVTYTPTAGYYGADSFTFTATGPGGTSAPATVSLTVGTPAAPVVAARSGVAVAFNSQGTAIDLSSSVSGVASSISIVTAPARGTTRIAGNVVTYTPNADTYGADSFTYTATGPGGTSAPAIVSLTVATPAAPVAAARSGVAVAFNSQGTAIDLSSSVSGVASSISIVTPPARGTTRIAGNVVTYTPNADTYGADSFTYTATGPGGTSAPATVSLTVAGSVPRVQPQSGSATDGEMVSIELTRGAAIGPFTAAQVVSVSPANAATTSITSTGDGAARRYFVEATPAARFGGTITINYTLTNVFGVSPAGVVTLTVAARLDPANDTKVRALSDAQVQATRQFGRSQIVNFMRRNEQLHSGRARSSQNISVNIIDPTRERRPEDRMAVATMPVRDSDKQAVTESHYAAPAEQDEKPAGVFGAMSMWVSGAIDIATRDASSFAPKLSATTQGISGGVDFQISKRTTIGIGGGYGNVTSNIDARAAELRATSNLVAVYGSTKLFENGFLDVVAGHGFLDYTTRRRIDGTELTALGSRTGNLNLAGISFGINKQVKDLDWSFYSKLEYMNAKLAAYTETSGGSRNNLRLSALDDTSYSAGLGFRLQKAFATGIGTVTPRLRSEFGREFGKANVQYVDYANIADATSRGIQGRLNEQNFYQTSIGTMIDLKSDWSVDLEYALTYNSATLTSGIKVQLSRPF